MIFRSAGRSGADPAIALGQTRRPRRDPFHGADGRDEFSIRRNVDMEDPETSQRLQIDADASPRLPGPGGSVSCIPASRSASTRAPRYEHALRPGDRVPGGGKGDEGFRKRSGRGSGFRKRVQGSGFRSFASDSFPSLLRRETEKRVGVRGSFCHSFPSWQNAEQRVHGFVGSLS